MNDDNMLAQALMARFELQFARQSEMLESTTMRMQSTLARAGEIAAEQKRMGDALTKIENKFAEIKPM